MSEPTDEELDRLAEILDKPLHVRVAEALGWRHAGAVRSDWGTPPGRQYPETIPRYDTDWGATGPLIERYEITILRHRWGGPHRGGPILDVPYWQAMSGMWEGYDGVYGDQDAEGPTPLIAVCNLILALHAAGKLEAA